jgi:4,5-DOPA dioxygenase extradiol
MPALFVSHGAATLTMDEREATHRSLVELGAQVRAWRPEAVLVLSAHDVRPAFTVGSAPAVEMIQDHPAAQGRRWSAPGHEQLAAQVLARIQTAGLRASSGAPVLDHGAWVPLSLLFPAGDVPVVTLSLSRRLVPGEHLALGHAVAALRDHGVLIIGSGGATHNQNHFRRGFLARAAAGDAAGFSRRFDDWLVDVVQRPRQERDAALLAAPEHADFPAAHPSLDHWLPVLFAAGAAGDDTGAPLVRGFQHSLSMTAIGFGAPPTARDHGSAESARRPGTRRIARDRLCAAKDRRARPRFTGFPRTARETPWPSRRPCSARPA